MTDTPDSAAQLAGGRPRPWQGRGRLTPRERRTVALAAAAPTGGVLIALVPFVATGRASMAEILLASVVYGALLGLAAAFVAVDRLQARQCPGCSTRNGKSVPACGECGYDLVGRPRFQCDQRHQVHLDPGLCSCGRRLVELPPARGIGREITVMLKVGGWLLAFLMGMGVLLRAVG